MKLIECYVNNFGKLSDFSYKFDSGFNAIQKENGFGKSTLAAFIKTMLFGLEDTKRQDISENDRKKYEPWQGGAWGGSLTFESGGKKYRVERSFSKKSSLDEVKIYNLETAKLTDDFKDKEIGEVLLGIDRDGFERTVFLSERDIDERKVNNSVSAKLSNLTGVAFDITELDCALKLLEEERKYYYKHGGSGAISDITEKISVLEYKRAELLSLEKKHEEDFIKINRAENEIRALKSLAKEEMEEDKRIALRMDRYAEYKRKLSERAEFSSRAEKIFEFFSGKIPEKETLYDVSVLNDEIAKLEKEAKILESEVSEQAPIPSEKELDNVSFLNFKIKENREKIRVLEDKKINTGTTRAKKSKYFSILGSSLVIAGGILGFLFAPLFLIAALGIVLFAHGVLNGKKRESPDCETIRILLSETEELHGKLAEYLIRFELDCENFEFAISKLRNTTKENEAKLALLREKTERLDKCIAKRSEISAHYPVINGYPIGELSSKIDAYAYVSASAERLEKECAELAEQFNFSENEENGVRNRRQSSDELILKERELTLLKNNFSIDEIALEELDEINASLESLKESEAHARYKYATVKKTKSYLEAAKDSLTAKYLGKTRESFSKYVALVSQKLGEYGIDTSFAVTKTEDGQTRIKDSFSKGTQKLYDFALRLSFSDSLYEGELPFLMLDDPFAYFDDEKLSSALSLVKELGKERQIIYFTAAKSRT